ncbi:hypothetical protein OQA88_10870 [Cercophora sp. LCS_1]
MDPSPATEAGPSSGQDPAEPGRMQAPKYRQRRRRSRLGSAPDRFGNGKAGTDESGTNGWSVCKGSCSHASRSGGDKGPNKRCLSGLWTNDPRKDKSEVNRSASSPSSHWILEKGEFHQFLRDDSSRLLWIQTGSPEDNLSGVIDKLPSLVPLDSAVAYCFCPPYDRQRGPKGDAVGLSGLIYLLVEAHPFLAPWVWKEKPDLDLEQGPIASRLRILKRILAHPKLRNVFLVIDGLGISWSGWEQAFLDFILQSAESGRAKWIISSRFSLVCEQVQLSPFSAFIRPDKPPERKLRLDPAIDPTDAPGLVTPKWLRYLDAVPVSKKFSTFAYLKSPGQMLYPLRSRKGIAPETPRPDLASGKKTETLRTYEPIYEELVPYDEFRTVLLWGGSETDGIKCTIDRQCIHHPPPFEALSYEWRLSDRSDADAAVMRSITVNGENFSVGQNLWDALRHLRPPRGDKRRLWIDAICIQQTSDQDRNVQVAIMPLIYNSATTVISWLGTTTPDVVKSSMVFLCELETAGTAKIAEERAAVSPRHAKMLKIMAGLPRSHISEETVGRFKTRRREWLDLRAFFSVRYWKRLWIVQEVVLSCQLRIQCEDCSIGWPTLASFFTYLRYADRSMPPHILDLSRSPASAVISYRLDVQSFPTRDFPPLRESLITFAGSRCSDPRDHVYGLLGVAAGDTAVEPDYSESTLGLYETMIGEPRLRTDDQLMSFSQLLQRSLGGLVHPPNPMPNFNATDDQRQRPGTLYTRARICGNISLVGDTYTTVEKAKELLTDWHSLYFHHVRTHRPGDELPSSTKHALLSIHKNARKAVAVDSRLSYAYVGIGSTTEQPIWNQILRRYEDEAFIASRTPEASETLHPVESDSCPGSAIDGELCQCLRTKTLASTPRWIIGTRGQIGLVAGTAREGDIICHFENSDVAVIVRPFADGWLHSIVGRGLILRQWDEEAARIHDSSPELFTYSVGTERKDFVPFRENVDQMSFHLDRACLRLLSAHSSSDIPQGFATTMPRAPLQEHYEGT